MGWKATAFGLGAQAVRVVAAGVDTVRTPPPGVVVLIYHRVGARTPMKVDLPTAQFDEHLAALAASGSVITLDTAVEVLAGRASPPCAHPVVVTFDDGTADWVDEVAPLLVRHRVPATFYVATAFVDEQRPFPHDGRPISWAGLAELVATGFATIGSHTHSHRVLADVGAAEAADELDRSIGLIGDRLGVRCAHFAYPKAVPGSAAAEAEVRARFTTAALAGSRVNRFEGSDRHRLWRTPVQTSDTPAWFRRKAAGGLAFEGRVREVLAGKRYAGATT